MRKALRLLFVICLFACAGIGQTFTNIDTQTKGSRPSYWGTDSGTANAYVVATVAPAGPTLRTGSRYYFVVGHTNTGASTLTVDGFNHAVKKNISTALASGDWTVGQVVEVVFDGTNFQWISFGTLSALGSVSCSQLPALTGDITTSAGSCATTLATPIAIAKGGTGTTSTLTGLVRGSGSAFTAAELSGDVTTSGSNAATVVKVNGASVPASSTLLGSNSSNQLVAKERGISFTIGDSGATTALTVAATTTDYVTVPFACTITAYNLAVDAGTITVKFWKVATGSAIPTSSNSISTSGVSISSGTAIHSTTVTDFTTTTITANDIMAMNVTAVSTAKYVNGVLECK
jgi:hypothetical protein